MGYNTRPGRGQSKKHNNVRENEPLLRRTAPQNMQQAGTQNGLGVFSFLLGCGQRSAPAWSQDGGQGKDHKVKIEEAGAWACPATTQDGCGLSTQQSAVMTDGALWQAIEERLVSRDTEVSQDIQRKTSMEQQIQS